MNKKEVLAKAAKREEYMQEEFSEIMNKLSENARFALQKSDYYINL